MYRKRNSKQIGVDDFIPLLGVKMSADNRWVKLSHVIPWERIEERYDAQFGKCGNVAIPLCVAIGGLIIKEKCGFTDEKTLMNLSENNQMRYFVGYSEYRKRIDMAEIQKIINEVDEENRKDVPSSDGEGNRGMLILLLNLDCRFRFLWRLLQIKIWQKRARALVFSDGCIFVGLGAAINC